MGSYSSEGTWACECSLPSGSARLLLVCRVRRAEGYGGGGSSGGAVDRTRAGAEGSWRSRGLEDGSVIDMEEGWRQGVVRTIAGPVRAWIEWALDLPLWVAVEYHIHTLIPHYSYFRS